MPWNAEDYRPLDPIDPNQPRLVALVLKDNIDFTRVGEKTIPIDASRLGKPKAYIRKM